MIERGPDPAVWEGLGISRGFVDYGEDPEDAVLRELQEETGIEGENPRVLHILGALVRSSKTLCRSFLSRRC